MKILLTGTAGFIGFHLATKFLERGDEVLGVDNLNDYYDVSLKEARLVKLQSYNNFKFQKMDIADRLEMSELFAKNNFDKVVHMAAQAGVRYSLENPHAYIQANIVGFLNILEGCRYQGTSLIYASSSSVYGSNTKLPFSTSDNVDHPISLYAATKKADELMAYAYSHLYGFRTTGLRFFTVYGPWGRPDMALLKFTKAILSGESIDIFNKGKMKRDFTYIDDVVDGVVSAVNSPLLCKEGVGGGREGVAKVYNLGNNHPTDLMDFVRTLEDSLGKKAKINYLPIQPGDVLETYADIDEAKRDFDFSPKTPISKGIPNFVEWYLSYYEVQKV